MNKFICIETLANISSIEMEPVVKESLINNELGNSIRTRVEELKGEKSEDVKISIVGPTSSSEWILTLKEAKEVHRLLDNFVDHINQKYASPEECENCVIPYLQSVYNRHNMSKLLYQFLQQLR